MARSYGTIELTFWNHTETRRISHDALVLLFYLRSAPVSNATNAYVIPMQYILHDTRMDQERVTKAFRDLALKPHALYDSAASVVMLPGMFLEKSNKIANPNVAKYVAELLLALPDCKLKERAIEELKTTCNFTETVAKAIGSWTLEPGQPNLPFSSPGQGNLLPPAPPPPDPPVAAKKPRSEGTRLTEDWQPPVEFRDWALKAGLSEARIDVETVKFVRYFTGPDCKAPVKKSWYQAWQNWIESVPKGNGSNGNGNGSHAKPASSGSGDPPWQLRVKEFNKSGMWLASWGPEPGKPGCKAPAELLAPVS